MKAPLLPPLLVAAALLLSACAGTATGGTSDDGLPVVPASAGHVHGAGVNPADGLLYLGTHAGLMVVGDEEVESVGESTVDLMGFAVAGPDHFYASGHPGPNDRLPQPVGLIETRDGGESWQQLSLGGQSDFHTLTADDGVVHGFDGALRSTEDGKQWKAGATDVAPASLAALEGTVLATTQRGVVRSTDGGASFAPVAGAPVLLFLSWSAIDALWGVDPSGGVHLSADGGTTWEARGSVGTQPQTFTAVDDATVLAVLDEEIVRSTDGGKTFTRIAARD